MLEIFPQGFDATLLVPVLIGLVAMVATTEWWGWDFVGVVVPGYLAALARVEPVAAAVVLVEAAATLGLVRLLDRAAVKARLSYPVFGRDRFYLILAASIPVRIVLETWILQAAADLLAGPFPALAVHRTALFGVGVVLVPLTANRFWKPGLLRGGFQLGVHAAVTGAALGLLMRFTNFSIGGFDLAFDQLALSFLSSPRAQIAVLLTAALASAFNRRFGWDYHGILVPALLALAALSPLKFVATLVEAAVIVLAAMALVRLPAFRGVNLEGTRKLLLCYTLGFALKLALAAFLAGRFPGYRASDFFGLGYLLPSLLAERVWLRSNLPLILIPTVQTSLAGAGAAAALVAVLTWLAPPAPAAAAPAMDTYASLPQAVAALAPAAWSEAELDAVALARLARREPPAALTADGYTITLRDDRAGLVALRPGATHALWTHPQSAEATSAAAASRGAALLLASDEASAHDAARVLGLPLVGFASEIAPPKPTRSELTARELARPASPEPGSAQAAPAPIPQRALAEAGFRLDRDRAEPARLAVRLAPLGLSLIRSSDGAVVARGAGWPTIILRPRSTAVVAAAHASEIDAPGAALFAADRLDADVVLAVPGTDGAVSLASALAAHRGRPLLVVRGAAELAGAEALLIEQPSSGSEDAAGGAWLEPLTAALGPWLPVAREVPDGRAELRAFPPRAGRLSPAALLWLSPSARQALAGGLDQLDRPEILALAARRGLPIEEAGLLPWLEASRGAPSEGAIAAAERTSRTRDLARLVPRLAGARTVLLLDRGLGLAAVGVDENGRRAAALTGLRREARASAATPEQLERALASGTRTVLAEAHP